MPIVETDDCLAQETREKAREETRAVDEADSCAAGVAHEPDHVCTRGSQCHCARPIGHPIPVALPDPRTARR